MGGEASFKKAGLVLSKESNKTMQRAKGHFSSSYRDLGMLMNK